MQLCVLAFFFSGVGAPKGRRGKKKSEACQAKDAIYFACDGKSHSCKPLGAAVLLC